MLPHIIPTYLYLLPLEGLSNRKLTTNYGNEITNTFNSIQSVPVSQPPVEHHGHSCTSVQHEEIHPGFHHRTSLHSEVDVSKVARRHRLSPFPLVTVEEAVQKVLEHAHVCSIETVSYSDALGRVLAEDVFAKDPLPPFRASIKDGYAVISSDGAGLRKVLGDCAAGAMPKSEVIPGYCIRINTGAPIPAGADAVIQVEDTELVKDADAGRSELEINLISTPKPGQDIRPLGCDIEKGQLVLQKNLRLGPSELGLLATVGVTSVKCYRVPNVGVLSTGNELLDPSKPLKPGHIRDSNRTTLLALLREQGYVPLDLGIAEDSTMSLLEQMTSALEKCDVLITSGGVSMGDKDLIKEVIQVDLKAKIHFGRVFMKPGKPTTFATAEYEGAKKLLFCLPGNPVSATVTSNLYVLPALRKMSGNISPKTPLIKAKLGFDLKLDSRPEYHRAVLTWDPQEDLPVAQSTGNQLSSRLLSMRAANAMLLLPARSEDIPSVSAGFVVSAMMIGPM